MRRFSPTFSAMLSLSALLTGCFEDDQILLPEPPVEEAPRLEEGAYEVQVAAVDLLDCRGVSEREIVGQSLWVELSHRAGSKVVVEWDGVRLKGKMAGGALSVSGEQALWYDTGDTAVGEEPPEEDGDEPVGSEDGDAGDSDPSGGDDTDTDTGGGSDPSEGDTGGGSDPSEGDTGGTGDEDAPDADDTSTGSGGSGADEAPDMSMSLALELAIRTEQIADGRFHYLVESGGQRCEIEAQVGVIWVGKREREPQPVYEDTETDVDTDTDTDTDAG